MIVYNSLGQRKRKNTSALAFFFLLSCTLLSHQQVNSQGCFEFRSLSCLTPQDQGDDLMDVQIACLAMEQALRQQGQSVRLLEANEDSQQHERALQHLTVEDDLCYGLHQAYHKCWWCAQIVLPEPVVHKDFCQFKSCSRPPQGNASSLVTLQETCQQMQTVQEYGGYPATMEFCQRAEEASFLCPVFCETSYLGADTLAQKRGLVWMARTTAFFTLFGAIHILYDIGRNHKKRQSVYHQLLFAMATFDVATGIAWGLSTWPIPSDFFWIHGAKGSTATCTAQAFFVQWGFTSMFYNVSLAIYYTLVIVYTYKEHQLMKLRPYLLGVPFVTGTALALGAIPFYDWFEYGCHFLVRSFARSCCSFDGQEKKKCICVHLHLFTCTRILKIATARWTGMASIRLCRWSAGDIDCQYYYQHGIRILSCPGASTSFSKMVTAERRCQWTTNTRVLPMRLVHIVLFDIVAHIVCRIFGQYRCQWTVRIHAHHCHAGTLARFQQLLRVSTTQDFALENNPRQATKKATIVAKRFQCSRTFVKWGHYHAHAFVVS